MPYDTSKNYVSRRAAWARGRGHQAAEPPRECGQKCSQDPWRGLPRLQSALLLQQFLFSVSSAYFCKRGEKKLGGKSRPDRKFSACPIEYTMSFFTFCLA